jgi:hypothetical protein
MGYGRAVFCAFTDWLLVHPFAPCIFLLTVAASCFAGSFFVRR